GSRLAYPRGAPPDPPAEEPHGRRDRPAPRLGRAPLRPAERRLPRRPLRGLPPAARRGALLPRRRDRDVRALALRGRAARRPRPGGLLVGGHLGRRRAPAADPPARPAPPRRAARPRLDRLHAAPRRRDRAARARDRALAPRRDGRTPRPRPAARLRALRP